MAKVKTKKKVKVDNKKQNSPSLLLYGMIYRAKTAGVSILYQSGESLSVEVFDSKIVVTLLPLVTTNKEIADLICATSEALELIYPPEIVEPEADVDTPGTERKI